MFTILNIEFMMILNGIREETKVNVYWRLNKGSGKKRKLTFTGSFRVMQCNLKNDLQDFLR